MITGAQMKILLETDENGNFKINSNQAELLGLIENKYNWKLVREHDGLTHHAAKIGWIEWNDNGTFKTKHDEPNVGRSLILDPHRLSYTWLTTVATEIIEQQEKYVKFKTLNSVYELFKI